MIYNYRIAGYFRGANISRLAEFRGNFFLGSLQWLVSNLNRALSNAGVAAREAEMRKDAKYEEHVHRNGGRFVPLVMESLGLWSPLCNDHPLQRPPSEL